MYYGPYISDDDGMRQWLEYLVGEVKCVEFERGSVSGYFLSESSGLTYYPRLA